MRLIMPSYCKNFKCTADKCKDNCCIGWEIDIDEKTKSFYDSVSGDFGKALANGINDGETPCFKLKDERCAFLNERGLCEIIINLGEKHLCQICRDHPRYFEWFEDRIEGGVGLCCEEGARLILSCDEPFSLFESEKDDEPFSAYDEVAYDLLVSTRRKIIETLERKDFSFSKKQYTAFAYGTYIYDDLENFDPIFTPYERLDKKAIKETFDINDLFLSLNEFEEINTSWNQTVSALIKNQKEIEATLPYLLRDSKVQKAFQNISIYFYWRYYLKFLFDENYINAPYFSVFSVIVILCLFALRCLENNSDDFDTLVSCAKDYSKQMEYSTFNLVQINKCSHNEKLSAEKLISLLF